MSLRLPPDQYAELTQYVFDRDGWRCRNCNFRRNLSAHHIQFRSQGGEDTDENLVTLCMSCHDGVHLGGLVIVEPANAEEHLIFRREEGWRPR